MLSAKKEDNSYQYRVDYNETFTPPVACFNATRILIVLATHKGWLLHQLDVKSIFFNRELKEEVCVEEAPNFIIESI